VIAAYGNAGRLNQDIVIFNGFDLGNGNNVGFMYPDEGRRI
jgi:hypothetical protein